jgi:hypothetical protein
MAIHPPGSAGAAGDSWLSGVPGVSEVSGTSWFSGGGGA